MKTNSMKILLGNSIPLEEEEINYNDIMFKNNNEIFESDDFNLITEKSALFSYYFSMLLNSIGRSEFKMNFLLFINEIKNECEIKLQRKLCFKIMEYINKIYDFEFPEKLDLLNKNDINDFYDFLKFIEYDNEDMIINIWKYLKIDSKDFKIKEYCKNHKDEIIKEIEYKLETEIHSKYIDMFLKNYEKDKMIDWFSNQSLYNKTLILYNNIKNNQPQNI